MLVAKLPLFLLLDRLDNHYRKVKLHRRHMLIMMTGVWAGVWVLGLVIRRGGNVPRRTDLDAGSCFNMVNDQTRLPDGF